MDGETIHASFVSDDAFYRSIGIYPVYIGRVVQGSGEIDIISVPYNAFSSSESYICPHGIPNGFSPRCKELYCLVFNNKEVWILIEAIFIHSVADGDYFVRKMES